MIIAVNKPYGVLSQFNKNPDYPDQRTLTELELPPELLPVGRLDMDSEGLLLLTDEKELENELVHPSKGHSKTYLVQIDGSPSEGDLDVMRRGGMVIRGHKTKPCKVRLLKGAPSVGVREPVVDPTSAARSTWIEMVLTEGKNRQVRRMTAQIGFPTLRLVRSKIGSFSADDLSSGKWRVISDKERKELFKK